MRKVIATAVLGSLIVLASATSASAHADMDASNPANGAVIAKAPTTIKLTFSEPVALNTVQLLDAQAKPVPSNAKVSGASVIVTPTTALPQGAVSTQWNVTSDDGHVVTGAVSFIIGRSPATGKPVAVATLPKVPTTLSGSKPGQLSISFTTRMSSGSVVWSNPSLAGPITWNATGNGHKVTAEGVLPFPGQWTMQSTLVGKNGSVLVTNGKVNLA